jgi:hypothetical protein
MCELFIPFVAVAVSVVSADPSVNRVQEHFKSNNYTVTWGTVRTFDPGAELEIGDGNGHGFYLGWLRFRPGKNWVEVLSVQYSNRRPPPYYSKWPPDVAPVTVKKARMKNDDYTALLGDMAAIDAAVLHPVQNRPITGSFNDFWVNARLMSNETTLLYLDWVGYWESSSEVEFAKPQAAVARAHAAVKELDFKEHALLDEERGWASTKFVRDWKKFKDRDFHWWEKEFYLIMIGVVGDKAVFPTLRDVLENDLPDRNVYHAINAVTRLTKQDVRDRPAEEMDIDRTRRKVLDLLRDGK